MRMITRRKLKLRMQEGMTVIMHYSWAKTLMVIMGFPKSKDLKWLEIYGFRQVNEKLEKSNIML